LAKLGAGRNDVYKRITVDYYGWKDEEDGVLLEMEEKARRENKRRKISEDGDDDSGVSGSLTDVGHDYLDVPSQEEVAKILLAEKKKNLLAKFAF